MADLLAYEPVERFLHCLKELGLVRESVEVESGSVSEIEDYANWLTRSTKFLGEGFITDAFGFFLCSCSRHVLEPGIYILFSKIRSFIARWKLEPLSPEELAYFVLAHEAVHMLIHSLIPRDIRATYYRRQREPFEYELEEAFCEYTAHRLVRDGYLQVFSLEIKDLIKLGEIASSAISSLKRFPPYAYYSSLLKMAIAGLDDEVQRLLWAYVSAHSLFNEYTVKATFGKVLERPMVYKHLVKALSSRIKMIPYNWFESLKLDPCHQYVITVIV